MESKIIRVKDLKSVPKNFTGMVKLSDGRKNWYKKGKLHRLDGPAVEYLDGRKYWYKEGEYHRLDGPAVEYLDGTKEWYKEGKLHRIDGPAIEKTNGTKEWWIDDKEYKLDYFNLLYRSSIYFGKEKGRYNLEWLKFLTEERIEEFPIIPGMELDIEYRQIFEKLSLEI